MAANSLVGGIAGTCTDCGAALGPSPRKGSIGEPLRQCPSCGKIVLCPGINEWSLLPAGQRARFVAHHALIALAVVLCAPVVGWAAARGVERPWRAWDAILWAAAGLALGALWQGRRLAGTIRRSQTRMRDPMYLAKLIEHQLAARR